MSAHTSRLDAIKKAIAAYKRYKIAKNMAMRYQGQRKSARRSRLWRIMNKQRYVFVKYSLMQKDLKIACNL